MGEVTVHEIPPNFEDIEVDREQTCIDDVEVIVLRFTAPGAVTMQELRLTWYEAEGLRENLNDVMRADYWLHEGDPNAKTT